MQSLVDASNRKKIDSKGKSSRLSSPQSLLLLVGACFVLYFIGVSTYPAVDPAEAYYVEAAREMVELGNYATPHLNYQIYFSKPILTFWLIAGSYNILGVSELASRIPFAILCTVYVLTAFLLGKHLVGNRAGLFSGLCLATSPLLLLVARESPIDIAFSTFLGIAVMCTAMTLAGKSKYSWPFIYVGLALSMLSKGPAGILLYCLAAGLFLLMARPKWTQLKAWLGRLKILPGFVLFSAIVLPWHVWVWNETEGLFLKVFFLYENIARYAGHTNMGRMSIWFFIPVLFVGFLPFVSLLIPGVRSIWLKSDSIPSDSKWNFISKVIGFLSNLKANILSEANGTNRALAFLLAFSAVTFAFFSLSGTKLITYILPIMGPIAVITALHLDKVLAKSENDKETNLMLKVYSLSFQGFCALVSVAVMGGAFYFFSELDQSYKVIASLGALLCLSGAFYFHRLYSRGQFEKAVYSSFATLVASWAILGTLGFHLFYSNQQSDLMKISRQAGKIASHVNMYGVFMPSSMFYAQKPVNTFFLAKQFVPVSDKEIQSNHSSCVIVRDRDFMRMKSQATEKLQLQEVEHFGQWGLYKTPGFKVEKVMILEDVFRAPGVFDKLMAGDTSMGPLTVPYAAGREYRPQVKGAAK